MHPARGGQGGQSVHGDGEDDPGARVRGIVNGLPVTIPDLVILAVVLASGLLACFRGAVREFLFLATWGGAGLAAVYLYDHTHPLVSQWTGGDPLVAAIANSAGLFVVALTVFSLLSSAVTRRTASSGFSTLDRSLGFVFGLARGVLVVCLVYLVYGLLTPEGEEKPEWIREARLTPVISQGALLIVGLVPEEWGLAGGDFALDARDAVAADALRSYSDLIDPQTPPDDTGTGNDEGYNEEDRSALESIIAGEE